MALSFADEIVRIARSGRIGTILHIGAGQADGLDAIISTGADRIVLVEPQPAALRRLAPHDDGARVSVIGAALASARGTATLRLSSYPALSSLGAPLPSLASLFPGLRQTGEVDVPTLTLVDLVNEAMSGDMLGDGKQNVLIVEAAGAEHLVLLQLAEADLVSRFPHVFLSAGLQAMHEGAEDLPTLLSLTEDCGYRVRARDDDDPDFPKLHLQLEPLALDLRRRLAEIELLRAEAAMLEATQRDTADLLDAEKTRAATAEAALAAALDTAAAEGLRADDEGRARAELDRQRSALQADLADLTRRLDDTTAKAAARGKTIEAERARVAALEADLAAARSVAEDVQAQRKAAEATQDREALKAAVKARDVTITELRGQLAQSAAADDAGRQALDLARHRETVVREELLRAEAQLSLVKELLSLVSRPPQKPAAAPAVRGKAGSKAKRGRD